jgi:hypothetical protein
MNNGMFTAYINWCRISQPATEWEKTTSINGDGSLFSDKTLIFFPQRRQLIGLLKHAINMAMACLDDI